MLARWFDPVGVALLFLAPFCFVAWGVYVLRRWRGHWRSAAFLPAAFILLDAVLIYIAGGYAAGSIVGLHICGLLAISVVSGIHRALMLRSNPPDSRHSA